MRFLIVNDDGIDSPNLKLLAEMTRPFGEVTVVAPAKQCSAMSQHITVFGSLLVRPVADYPVKDVRAYSISGTPADCVKVGMRYLMPERPDMVFSGINMGLNTGYDIAYSGTVAAASEAVIEGVPAIAWSTEAGKSTDTVKQYFPEICRELLGMPALTDAVWNVNFPGCERGKCLGVRRNIRISQSPHYGDSYIRTDHDDGSFTLECQAMMMTEAEEGTDLRCVLDGYISVGTVPIAVRKG